MNTDEKKTIEVYGTRNTFTVYLITTGFAVVGGGLIIYHSGRILWSIWIFRWPARSHMGIKRPNPPPGSRPILPPSIHHIRGHKGSVQNL